ELTQADDCQGPDVFVRGAEGLRQDVNRVIAVLVGQGPGECRNDNPSYKRVGIDCGRHGRWGGWGRHPAGIRTHHCVTHSYSTVLGRICPKLLSGPSSAKAIRYGPG